MTARLTRNTHATIDSPVGPLTLVATDGVLSGLYLSAQRHRPDAATFGPADPADFEVVTHQLGEYFAGRRTAFDLPLAPPGTEFQRAVWDALRTIPYGRTWTYAELARELGRPGNPVRAVGAANGRNPISIVIPCHRVIGSDGSLTGYGGGLARKAFLLELERRTERARPSPSGPHAGSDGGGGRPAH